MVFLRARESETQLFKNAGRGRATNMVSRNNDGTITFFRPRRSAIIPMTGAVTAVARMVALTVRLTANSEAWKISRKGGSNGCVL